MLLIFDGMDKVGKTTLIHEIDKATQYQHIMIDRGPLSYLVYDKLLGRDVPERVFENYRDLADFDNINHLCILLISSPKVVDKRLEAVGEVLPNGLTSRQFMTEFAFQYFKLNHKYRNVLVLDTSRYNLETCVDMILNEIDKILSTNELIKLSPKFTSNDYTEYLPSYNIYTFEMLEKYTFDINVDKPYYEMLEAHLNHLLYKYSLELINSRQIVYNSLDCITNFQFIPNTVGKSGTLHITQRSLNIEHHGYNDLLFFRDWAKKNNLDVDKIYYNVLIPHKYNKYNFIKNNGELNAETNYFEMGSSDEFISDEELFEQMFGGIE